MPDRHSLEIILNDPASTTEEKAAAQTALDSHADPVAVHDDTRAMLAALKVERIADLNEEIFERHCVAHFVKQTDPIVPEFRYWIAPDDSTLKLIGMTRRDWWETIHKMAVAANRPDVQAHARRKLQEGNDE